MSVTYEQREDVAVITLDRPEVFNAIDRGLSEELIAALHRAGDDARAAIVTGAGKAFCAGADVADLMADYEAEGPDLSRLIRERFNPVVVALVETRVPTIGAVNGAAAGAGMGLALACDLRVLSERAYFLSAFINLALIPDSGSSWFLPQMVGVGRAMEITMSGRRVPADEAQAIGLAHRVVPPERLLEEAIGWASELADGPTEAYVETRRLIHAGGESTPAAQLAAEEEMQGVLGKRPAHMEGMRAFLEKRRPDFRNP